MKRRQFLQNTTLLGLSTVIPPFLISCSLEKKEPIQNILGKNFTILKKYNHTGNELFSYITLNDTEFDTEYKTKRTITIYELISKKKLDYDSGYTNTFQLFDKKDIYKSEKSYLDGK